MKLQALRGLLPQPRQAYAGCTPPVCGSGVELGLRSTVWSWYVPSFIAMGLPVSARATSRNAESLLECRDTLFNVTELPDSILTTR